MGRSCLPTPTGPSGCRGPRPAWGRNDGRRAPELPLRLIGSAKAKHEDFSASSAPLLQQVQPARLPRRISLAATPRGPMTELPILNAEELMPRLAGPPEALPQLV